MTEPLPRALRDALKAAHPALSDADLDRLDRLVSLHWMLHPEREASALRRIDRERNELLQQKMPHFREVYQQFRARQLDRAPPVEDGPEVQIEPRPDERR